MSLATSRTPRLPSAQEQAMARETYRQIAAIKGLGEEAVLHVYHGEEKIEIPMAAMKILGEILAQMAKGNAFSMMPIGYQLTTQQAADLMNVSRPYLVKLLEIDEIPFSKVGRHRRVKYDDVVAYMQKQDERSEEAMTELARQARKLGMGY